MQIRVSYKKITTQSRILKLIRMAYGNLKLDMGRRDITIKAIAKDLHIHRNSVSNKVNGPSLFLIEEAMIIKDTFVSDLDYEYLFQTDD